MPFFSKIIATFQGGLIFSKLGNESQSELVLRAQEKVCCYSFYNSLKELPELQTHQKVIQNCLPFDVF